jgi:hypothetical protein
MIIKIGLENQAGQRSTAIALDHPGLFCYGTDGATALAHVPGAVTAYKEWLDRHSTESWLRDLGNFDVRLVETFQVQVIDDNYELADEGYEVSAWFLHDWKPLIRLEVQHAQKLLEWGRMDLLETVKPLNDTQLDREFPNERWSIRGILSHVANAEWWYLTRLDLTNIERKELPEDAFERLRVVRELLVKTLPMLEGMEKVVGKSGELWSSRKIVRRAVWHELDHVEHIRKLIKLL